MALIIKTIPTYPDIRRHPYPGNVQVTVHVPEVTLLEPSSLLPAYDGIIASQAAIQ